MKQLTTVIPLLNGLARRTGAIYQLRKPDGSIVFSSSDDVSSTDLEDDLQQVCQRLYSGKKFHYLPNGDHTYACGATIEGNDGVIAHLLCRDTFAQVNTVSSSDGVMQQPPAEEVEAFFLSLVGIIQKNRIAWEEVQEMAEELDQSFEDLNLYAKIATQIKSLRFSSQMLYNLIEHLHDNMRADISFAILADQSKRDVKIYRPDTEHHVADINDFIEQLIATLPKEPQALSENYFILNDSQTEAAFEPLATAPYRFLSVPVHHNNRLHGRIGLVAFNMDEIFRQGELKMLISMAEQLAIVMANTELYYDLEQSVINMVKSMVFAIEAKDIYTRGHSERVSQYSLLIGQRLQLNKRLFRDLKWASILHDIGKIGIPGSILNKPGRLTDIEFDIIKKHPAKGGEILHPVSQLTGSLPGIIHHHERYDGKGYPDGLAGDAIPLVARIIAVADTFDAISSTRAYRKSAEHDKALAIVEEVSGSQLDPQMVAAFKDVYHNDITSMKAIRDDD